MNPLTLIDARLGIRLAAIALVALLGLLVVLTLLAGSSAADCLPDSSRLPGPAQDAVNAAQRALDGQPDPAAAGAGGPGGSGSVAGLDADQVANAAAIVQTGQQLGVPARGQVIALATARQESSLHNVTNGDQAGPDSRGLFQQRAAWGPEADRLNPSKAATMFYEGGQAGQPGLLDITGWQTMPLTRAAQAVQRSAHPDAYADDEAPAIRLLAVLAPGQDPDDRRPTQPSSTGTQQGLPGGVREQVQADAKRIPAPVTQQIRDAVCPGADDSGLPDTPANLPADFTLPPGTPAPVQAAIAWALQQRGGMYSFGGDCTQPLGTAAAHRCDCSSLIQQAYSRAGIPLPRTTTGQRRAGSAVPDLAHAHPGDLVFIPGALGTPAAPRHVGLALGHGLVLHAPGTGKPITISSLSGWNAVTIRRVVG